MSKWISAKTKVPISEVGLWSTPVVVICNLCHVYKLSYMGSVEGGCWQRSNEFIKNGSKEVTHWVPLPETE